MSGKPSQHPVMANLRREITESSRAFAWSYLLKYERITSDAPAEQSSIAKEFIARTSLKAIKTLASEADAQWASLLTLVRQAVEAEFVARLAELRNGIIEKAA
ncbi:putative HicB family RNase H-like nuclease [Rhodoblastus acidophilus]|uniref:hypothetical protein n=1 Tax=Rhodoblastus acidophilus TaxID=1074 RepID=UPI002224F5B4|nr:hypothetical protein [Rhodoblastus acidophilus]MCW2318535.1 putative HicB family RNase H-like nuclease [Rhodoblastus acidophilus]